MRDKIQWMFLLMFSGLNAERTPKNLDQIIDFMTKLAEDHGWKENDLMYSNIVKLFLWWIEDQAKYSD